VSIIWGIFTKCPDLSPNISMSTKRQSVFKVADALHNRVKFTTEPTHLSRAQVPGETTEKKRFSVNSTSSLVNL
jgi:hypothetical protein